jgi:hypothetical protein
MHYVKNSDFWEALNEYQMNNDDKGLWLEQYLLKLEVKYKNQKLTKEKYEAGLDFYNYKTQFMKDKIAKISALSPEENKDRLKRIEFLKESIGRTFWAIANGRIKTPQFIRYPLTDRDEMISDALYVMLRYADRFDCRRKNPFSYFTQTAFNAFIAYLNEKKKHEEKYQSINYIENLDAIQEFDNGLE